MIIVDLSQVAIAGCYAFQSDFKKGQDTGKMRDIIRHSFLMSILQYKRNYGKKYGEIVLACDGTRSWRKDTFAHYKAHRAKSREDSDMDWNSVFEHIGNLQEELALYFPWKTLKLHGAEGDDIVGILTKYVIENHTQQDGLFDVAEPVMIISSDGDFKQLHDFGDVQQYSPIQKKLVSKAEPDFLIDKIITGDSGDGVPSVLCPDDWFINEAYNGVRAKPVTKAIKAKFKAGLGLTDEEKRRFERNRQLISFEYIPKELEQTIIDTYKTTVPNKDLEKTMNFLMKVRAKQLLDRIMEFN